ncbi:MAG: DTW domain-containing protein [Methylotenera sp.]|nr:DTW domain-containing protein [Oligoflexia bacterium]
MPAAKVITERVLCLRCLKSELTCYCAQVRPFESDLQFILLQHPLERKRSIGTARMTHLCIRNSRLIAGVAFDDHPQVNELLENSGNHCVVLFPSENSLNVSRLPPAEVKSGFPADRKLVIFVIDGTWANAKSMMRRSTKLSALPQICFTHEKESEYKIRKQPAKYCLSTIEAVHLLIEILEPQVDSSILLEVFRTMVSQQVTYAGNNQIRRVGARNL